MIGRLIRPVLLALVALLTPLSALALAGAQSAPPRQILVLTRLAPQHFELRSTYGGGYGAEQPRTPRRRIAERIARRNGLVLADTWPLPLIGLDCFVMTVPDGKSVEETLRRISRDHDVTFAEAMQTYQAKAGDGAPNDPLYLAQPAARLWHLAALHRMSTGRGVKVAVIDSGIDAAHPDLNGQVAANLNFVGEGPVVVERHGTGVAGVIAAKAGNGIGIAGIAPDARLLGLRACWEENGARRDTVCDTLSLAKALHFAIEHGAQVVNLSLAGPRAELLDRLLDVAIARRIEVVAAVDPALPGGGFPASHHGVVAVADETLARPFAGIYIAPGQGVITTQPGGRWGLVDGSSFAAAHVSGLLALAQSRRPAADDHALLVAARRDGGSIDACATLLRASGPCACACPVTAEASLSARR